MEMKITDVILFKDVDIELEFPSNVSIEFITREKDNITDINIISDLINYTYADYRVFLPQNYLTKEYNNGFVFTLVKDNDEIIIKVMPKYTDSGVRITREITFYKEVFNEDF